MNIRQCRGSYELAIQSIPTLCPLCKRFFLPWGCPYPRPAGAALAQPRRAPLLPNETAWKARFTRLWQASEKPDAAARALAHQRVQVALPGWPGPAALSRVAGVHEGTASRILAALKAAGGSAP